MSQPRWPRFRLRRRTRRHRRRATRTPPTAVAPWRWSCVPEFESRHPGPRREILELGLPDDGYIYLFRPREIKNTGGGSYYYQNSKAKLQRVPLTSRLVMP